MATEYLKVLDNLKHEVTVVGRGEKNLATLKETYPTYTYISGGLDNYLENNGDIPTIAINAISVIHLKSSTIAMLNAGVKHILLEKPGALSIAGLEEIQAAENKAEAKVSIAYNRRFYSSIIELKKMAKEDGGIIGVHFEFTEWIHTIDENIYSPEALNKWVLSNSSHVIDTVFYLAGLPKTLNTTVGGKNEISWHPSGGIFVGSGETEMNIPFSYHTNWLAPGRWAIEVLTAKRRYYLKPMEKLQVQQKGSVAVAGVEIDASLDENFKPGLFLQVTNFLEAKTDYFVSLEEQIKSFHYYDKISGY